MKKEKKGKTRLSIEIREMEIHDLAVEALCSLEILTARYQHSIPLR
jgi:hypothetical protein